MALTGRSCRILRVRHTSRPGTRVLAEYGTKPVIVLWGFGFGGAGHTRALLRAIAAHVRTVAPGEVWLNEFDAMPLGTIGRSSNEQEADNFAETRMKGDHELIKKRVERGHKKVDYVPVIFPGGSGCNLSEGKWGWNNIKRNGGRFLWKQFYNSRKLGVRCIYEMNTMKELPFELKRSDSVSQSLHSLTSATDVQGVSLQASFTQCTSASEAKLEIVLSKNLRVAKQRQKEEQEKSNKEMLEAAHLRMLEQEKQQTADPASPIVMKIRKPKAN